MNTQAQLEELITSLASLVEYNTVLQQQLSQHSEQTKTELIEQSQQLQEQLAKQVRANAQQQQQITQLIGELTEQLHLHQTKESRIIDSTNQQISDGINKAFLLNQEAYHDLINQGFTQHIEQSANQLTEVQSEFIEQVTNAQNSLIENTRLLDKRVGRSADDLDGNVKKFRELQEKYFSWCSEFDRTAKKVSDETINSYTSHLKRIGSDFASNLASRLMWIVIAFSAIAICVCLFVAWFIIPSKDELSTRKAQYDELAKGQLLDNIIKTKDNKYYAEIDPKTCYEIDKKYWGKKTVCQFKD